MHGKPGVAATLTSQPYDVFVRAGFSVTLAGVGLTADQAVGLSARRTPS